MGERPFKMQNSHIHLMQLIFVGGITLGSRSFDVDNRHKWIINIARYVIYILTLNAVKSISVLVFELVNNAPTKALDVASSLIAKVDKTQILMYVGAVSVVYLNDQKIYAEEFTLMCLAHIIVSYQTSADTILNKRALTYGNGMACSYVEGYLVHVIPSDGSNYRGFQENIRYFESKQGVVFPIKKLFVIVTKTMHCPPDLNEFNDKSDRDDVTRMEACQISEDLTSDNLQSFREVVKDVAGVKDRYYKNSAYKITRPGKRPVYVAAECATSIHTLYKVLKNRGLYDELADINPELVVTEFIDTLSWVLQKSPDLKNKCEIIYFDDTNPDLNLADVLLERIETLEPNFDKYIEKN